MEQRADGGRRAVVVANDEMRSAGISVGGERSMDPWDDGDVWKSGGPDSDGS